MSKFANWRRAYFHFAGILAIAILCSVSLGCGAGSGSGTTTSITKPQVSVSIWPTTATVPIGTFQPFSAYAFGTTSTAVTWRASAGNIDQSGDYTAPLSMPVGEIATVTATSMSDPSVSASATVSVTTQPVSLSLLPESATVKAGSSQAYTATVVGTTNTSVTWSVNDLAGDSRYPGSILSGYYTAPAPVLATDTYSIVAVSNADPTKTASASVTVTPLENQDLQAFPIKLGASGVNANAGDCCSGTLGSLLADQNGKQYILSNNHIIGRVGNAAVGEAIVQPGFVDTLCNFNLPNTVAHFTAAPPIESSNVDAAIAEVVPGAVHTDGEIIGLGGIASDGSYIPAPPANTTVAATVGMPVAKSGRTTGLSCGTVQAVDGDILVDLAAVCGNPIGETVPFTGQVVISEFSQHGDSGSLIVEAATSRPVALVAGITDDLLYTTANPASDVLVALDSTTGLTLSFVGASQHGVSCSATSTTQARLSVERGFIQRRIVPSAEVWRAIAVKDKYEPAVMTDPAVLGMAAARVKWTMAEQR